VTGLGFAVLSLGVPVGIVGFPNLSCFAGVCYFLLSFLFSFFPVCMYSTFDLSISLLPTVLSACALME